MVEVHGLCRCGLYYRGRVPVVPIYLDEPERTEEPPHTHFTIRYWSCGRLVNLVSINKEPLKSTAKLGGR